MPQQVVQIKHIGNVTLSKNRRSKNIKLSVKPDKSVLVSFPFYVSSKEALAFVTKHTEWIINQQQKMEQRKTRIETRDEMLTWTHRVTFLQGESNRVMKRGEQVQVIVQDFESESSKAFIESVITEIYRIEAKMHLPKRLSTLSAKHGFSFNKVTIRDNRRNWGSCSSKNNISLNLQMMKLPEELIDYILLHELVHTEIKNHGSKFWQRLDEVSDGQSRQLAREVKKYSTYTL
ncbi:MAG TPA: SprT family zinc-dependent metalloprotease [Draconibacterium sp.]|nr:SprT family zinc-dependent metalloprotease [Draconibacterium sp.]